MKPIVTLTVNPALDASCVADEVVPVRKIRTRDEHYDAGGGGINVARVIRELGGETIAFYMAGGVTGRSLEGLIEAQGVAAVRIPIAAPTRVSHVVHETATGQEYRFTPEGPVVTAQEWRSSLEVLSMIDADYLVLSGSLARGMPADYYARVAAGARAHGTRIVLDTSGVALHRTLEQGVYLVKPSRRELETLLGRKAVTPDAENALAREVVESGRAEICALTLGARGAVLATRDGLLLRLESPEVEVKSAVGAGDSFVGAMTLALARGDSVADAFALGIAAGAATALTAGTGLCRRKDVERLYGEVRRQLPG